MSTSHRTIRHLPIGAFINAATVIMGSLIGLYFKQQFDSSYEQLLFQAVGLGIMVMGIQMGLKVSGNHWIILMLGLLFGTVLGVYFDISGALANMAQTLKGVFPVEGDEFTQGFVTAFIIFCIGAMTLLGSFEEGLSGNRSLILTKSILDGFTSVLLAGAYGIGVLFSVLPLLIFQGSITLGANYLHRFIREGDIELISGIGGILIIGIGFNMLGVAKISIESMLPSLFFALLVLRVFKWFRLIGSNQPQGDATDA